MNMDVTGLASSLIRGLLGTIYPPRCALCDGAGFNDRDICLPCYQGLPWLGAACVQCALPLPDYSDGELRCGRCLTDPPAFDHSLSLFVYRDDVIKLVHQLKFNQKLAYSRLLGSLLAEAIKAQSSANPDLILPVPLHPKRLRQRGYNQSAELARPVAGAIDVALDVQSVARTRDTQAQSELGKTQRKKNVRGAFRVVRAINAKHVAIVDDVVTTTSTANELARLLKTAGVERVDVWSIARAV